MQQKTLKELQNSKAGDSPYPATMIKVSVVKVGHTASFTSSGGDQASMLNLSVADGTEAMVATLSDESQFTKVREGRSLTIRNFLVKGNRLVHSKMTKIMAGQTIQVPEILKTKAVTLIMPPSPNKNLKDVQESPVRTIMTVQGEIIKDEAIKTVKVSQVDTKVRTLTIEDEETQVELTLWREMTTQPITIGDYVEVTHCVVSEWQKRKTLNTTRNTTIKKAQPQERNINGQVEAVSFDDTTCEVCVLADGIYKDFIVDIALIQNQLQRFGDVSQLSVGEMEEIVAQRLPFQVKLTAIGISVQTIEL